MPLKDPQMSQINADGEQPVNRAFSARSGVANIPGALPQARNEAAPLALNRDLSQGPVIDRRLVFNLRPSASSADCRSSTKNDNLLQEDSCASQAGGTAFRASSGRSADPLAHEGALALGSGALRRFRGAARSFGNEHGRAPFRHASREPARDGLDAERRAGKPAPLRRRASRLRGVHAHRFQVRRAVCRRWAILLPLRSMLWERAKAL